MKLVVDASVVIARLFHDDPKEANGERALQIFRALNVAQVSFIQPVHWLVEAAAVCSMKDPKRAQGMIENLYLLEIDVASAQSIFTRAIELAIAHKAQVFDTMYHAVALEQSATLITADRKYFNAAQSMGHIKLLEQFTL